MTITNFRGRSKMGRGSWTTRGRIHPSTLWPVALEGEAMRLRKEAGGKWDSVVEDDNAV